MFYLQSRYYAPDMGRFINADAFAATGCGLLGNNMYAYCNNNSVNLVDLAGTLPFGVRPMQVAMNDGGYIKNHTETDGDPKSADLAARHITIPNADGTVNSYVKRDGHYTYDPSNTTNYLMALGGLACLLIPTNFDDAVFTALSAKELKWFKTAFGTLSEIVAFRDNIATVLNLPSKEKTYDRYSITQKWTTKEPVIGRTDYYKETYHCMVSYYYCVDDGKGGYEWYPCGVSYSFTEQIYPIS